MGQKERREHSRARVSDCGVVEDTAHRADGGTLGDGFHNYYLEMRRIAVASEVCPTIRQKTGAFEGRGGADSVLSGGAPGVAVGAIAVVEGGAVDLDAGGFEAGGERGGGVGFAVDEEDRLRGRAFGSPGDEFVLVGVG